MAKSNEFNLDLFNGLASVPYISIDTERLAGLVSSEYVEHCRGLNLVPADLTVVLTLLTVHSQCSNEICPFDIENLLQYSLYNFISVL